MTDTIESDGDAHLPRRFNIQDMQESIDSNTAAIADIQTELAGLAKAIQSSPMLKLREKIVDYQARKLELKMKKLNATIDDAKDIHINFAFLKADLTYSQFIKLASVFAGILGTLYLVITTGTPVFLKWLSLDFP